MHVAAILKMKGRNVVTTTADKSLLLGVVPSPDGLVSAVYNGRIRRS
jgi:hypothetical protein